MKQTWKFDSKVAASFREHARSHIPGYDRVIDKTISVCRQKLQPDSKIIDVGCAVGETLERLRSVGFTNLIGVDNSTDMLKAVCLKDVKLICSDVLPKDSYDAVLINWTLHFIQDKRQYLKDIYESLNENGFLFLSDKTSEDKDYLQLYHRFKKTRGLREEEILEKAASLKGIMNINDQEWYRQELAQIGFRDVCIVDADWCFTSFLAYK